MDSSDGLGSNGYYDYNEVPSIENLELSQKNKIGDCHIFNFQKYLREMNLDIRVGSQVDVLKLSEVFSALDFNVKHYHNLPACDTLTAIWKAAQATRQGKYLVCCFLSHGNAEDKVAAYNQWLSLEDMLAKCSDIIGKNKIIFIIQACRSNDLELEKLLKKEYTDFGLDKKFYSDVLIARSTYPGTVSMKRPDHGSYFIQEVCHTLKYISGNMNIFEVLTVVNFRMANFFETCIKSKKGGQMPIFYSTLTSEIVLNAIGSPTEPYVESLLGQKLKENGYRPNNIYKLKYDFTPEKVNFFGIYMKEDKLPELKNAAAYLRRGFKKSNFPHIKPYEVSKRSKFREIIKETAKMKSDCVFYLISGHSSYGSLCDSDGKKIYQSKVIEYFVENQIPYLLSKPKIFLFLMFEPDSKPDSSGESKYSGESKDISESKDTGESWDGGDSIDLGESKDTGESCDIGESSNFIAQHADILEIHIIVKGETTDVFKPVNAIVEQLNASSDSEDLLSILTKVNCKLVKGNFVNNENNFYFNSTLTKKLVFPKQEQIK